MKYYIIAGEASGDLHASNLMLVLKQQDPNAQFRVWGGDKMVQAGGELVKHYRELAFMGFVAVLKNLKTIFKNIKFCKTDILNYKPDVVILVDYPGFNLRIAKFLKKNKIKTFFYISPQVWAWHTSRVKRIKQVVDKMFVILPFEKDFYKKWNYDVDFVGHPLLDAIENRETNYNFRQDNNLDIRPIIALLPGSRKQEIDMMLSEMLKVIIEFPDYQFVVAGISQHNKSFYEQYIGVTGAKLIVDQTYDLLSNAHTAIVTSGTATLETALFEVPQIVGYKGGRFSYYFARWLIKVKYIALVNLIMDKHIVTELIQADYTAKNIKTELFLLSDTNNREKIINDYKHLKENLGGIGASTRAAKLMYGYLTE